MPLSSVVGASSILKPGVCTSSTRPAAPYEGQTIYETDTDRLLTYDGSAWIPYVKQTAGKVLQVVSTTKTDTFTTTSTTYTDITGVTATITPSSTSSKIFITAATSATGVAGTTAAFLRLARGGTAIAVGDAAGNRVQATSHAPAVSDSIQSQILSTLDSPSTTSPITYSVQIRCGTGGTVYVNRTVTDPNQVNDSGRFVSAITVMEISG